VAPPLCSNEAELPQLMVQNIIDRAEIEKVATSANSRLDMWIRLIQLAEIVHMAEIGVWRGDFAAAALDACPKIQSYFMIDPWRHLNQWKKPMNVDDATFEDIHQEVLRRTETASDRRVVLRGTTLEVIDKIPDASLDFIYIDGDHTLRGVTIDLISSYSKVRPGWYIGGDDFCPTIWQHYVKFEPTLVFPFVLNFAEAVGATIYCLPFNQFLMRKPDGKKKRELTVIDLTGQYGETDLLPQLSPLRFIGRSLHEKLPLPIASVSRRFGQGLKLSKNKLW